MKSESHLQAEIFRALGQIDHVRLFRNNTGQAWVGRLLKRNPDGSVLLANARPLHAGLFKGSADLIGWCRGRFLSIEVKSATGHPTPEQVNWHWNVTADGGIAGIVRSVEEAERLVSP